MRCLWLTELYSLSPWIIPQDMKPRPVFFFVFLSFCLRLCQKAIYSNHGYVLVHHLSLYTFFFYLGNRSTHLTGNFFHTCTENTSLFVFGTVQKKLHTVAKKGRSPEMTSAQSTAADPHLLHLVRFSFSINKCFHIFTFYSPSLSLSPTHKTRMNHGGRCAAKPRQPMYIS